MQQSLEDLLIQTRLISSTQLAVAQRESEMRGTSLPDALIDLGLVTDRKFAEWLSGATSIPLVDPLRGDVIEDVQNHLPAEIAQERRVVPIDVNADEMTVVTVNPLDRALVQSIQESTGLKIHAVIGIRDQLAEMIARVYPKPKAFDPSATVAIEMEPFAFGDETLLRMHSRDFALNEGDGSLGSETRVGPSTAPGSGVIPDVVPADETTNPVPEDKTAKAPETQLDRIEHHLVDLLRAVDTLQRRVDAIDAVLARTVNRER